MGNATLGTNSGSPGISTPMRVLHSGRQYFRPIFDSPEGQEIFTFACAYTDMKWKSAAAKYRKTSPAP